MKKILVIGTFLSILFTGTIAYSATNSISNEQTRINNIGQTVVTKNKLPKEISFKVVDSTEVNAYADANNQIVIYTGLLKLVENNEELAGIISHEIGHIMKSHCYKQTFANIALNYAASKITNDKAAVGAQIVSSLASNKLSREQEYDADYTSADLIHKAGYNPLGLISALNKISTNYVDFMEDHPSGDKRLMALYDYINYNYPDSIKKGFNTESYKSFLNYAKPTIDSRANNKKINDKYIKTQKKLKAKREKAAKKMMRQSDPWAVGYSTLMLMSTQEN